MVTAKDIRGGRIDYAGARHTSQAAYETRLTDKSRPRIGDVLLTKDGSIGRVAVCDRDQVCINQSVALLRSNDLIAPEFLGYLLQAPLYQERMERDSGGSTIKHIYITRVDKMPIMVPPVREQLAITSVLAALDDKIAVNRRITITADKVSGELFRHATLTSPERFTERALSDTAEFINGRAFTKGATGTGRMVVRIAEMNSGPGSSTVYNDIEVPEQHLARPGDVLFAWSGSLTVARWFRPEAIINQHIFKCVPKHGYPHWLVSQLVHRKIGDFRAIAADKATTMGHIQRKHLDEPVIVPESQELVSLDSQIAPLWERALLAERESLDIATLRDTLLPQLMSGRLRVKDAEKIVEDAT
jgi:type I restriction enzyme S subunit